MTAATQRIVSWPRLMRAEVLGAYCGISKNTVKKDVRDGRLPKPVITEPGRVQWDKAQVDEALDRLTTGNGMDGWDDLGE